MLETMKPSYMVTRVPAGTFLNYVRSILTSSAKHDPRIMVSSSTWSMTREIVFFFPTLRHVRFRIRCEESRYGSNYFFTFLVIVVSSFFCFFFHMFLLGFLFRYLSIIVLYLLQRSFYRLNIFYIVNFDWSFIQDRFYQLLSNWTCFTTVNCINCLIGYFLHRQFNQLFNWIFFTSAKEMSWFIETC